MTAPDARDWCAKHGRFEPSCLLDFKIAEAAAFFEQDGGSPIRALLFCPVCKLQHVDEGEWATKPHRKHLCASCGNEWRAAAIPTVGVREL